MKVACGRTVLQFIKFVTAFQLNRKTAIDLKIAAVAKFVHKTTS